MYEYFQRRKKMKTISALAVAAMLVVLVIGCGEKTEGPQDITPPSSVEALQETAPPDVVAVDEEPALVKSVGPVYPEEARKNGLEGTVYVKIWVDTEGKAKEAVILKSDDAIFNQASLDAAKQFQFTPASKDGKPVAVWVSVPFKFKLAEK
jgi:TonB family protein